MIPCSAQSNAPVWGHMKGHCLQAMDLKIMSVGTVLGVLLL